MPRSMWAIIWPVLLFPHPPWMWKVSKDLQLSRLPGPWSSAWTIHFTLECLCLLKTQHLKNRLWACNKCQNLWETSKCCQISGILRPTFTNLQTSLMAHLDNRIATKTLCIKTNEAFSWLWEQTTQLRKDADYINDYDWFNFQVGAKEHWSIGDILKSSAIL